MQSLFALDDRFSDSEHDLQKNNMAVEYYFSSGKEVVRDHHFPSSINCEQPQDN